MQQLDDKTWHAFISGSGPAFRKVYESYFGFVSFIVSRIEQNASERDDVIQEVFLKCWQSKKTLKSPDQLGGWFAVIARNIVIDKWRSKRRSKEVSEQSIDSEATDMFMLEPTIEDRIDWLLIRAVAKQQTEQDGNNILELFYFQGHTVHEIAKLKRQAPSTVSTNLTRARRKLKEALTKMGFTRER